MFKSMNTVQIVVERAISSYLKCMRLKRIGFIGDKYINMNAFLSVGMH